MHTCVLCNHEAVIVRVSYTHNNKLFTSVPVRVCVNPECVTKAGGTVQPAKHLSRPRAY